MWYILRKGKTDGSLRKVIISRLMMENGSELDDSTAQERISNFI